MKSSKKWPQMFRSGSDPEPTLPIEDDEEALDLDQLSIDDLRMPGRDPLEQRPEPEILTRPKKKRGLMPFALAGAAVMAVMAVVFLAYGWLTTPVSHGDLPVVQAIDDPVKVKPESPGGLEVPYQEQLVLNGEEPAESGEPTVERLLPPPEEPQWPPPEPEGLAPVGSTVPGQSESGITAAAPQTPTEPIEVMPAQTAEPKAETPTPAVTQTAAAPTEPETKAPEPEAVTPEPVAKTMPTASGHLVQLASITSRDATKPAWKKLQAAHPDLLGDLALSVQRAEVNGKTYYRIQAGPFPNRTTALDVCAQLKTQKQDCLVVRR